MNIKLKTMLMIPLLLGVSGCAVYAQPTRYYDTGPTVTVNPAWPVVEVPAPGITLDGWGYYNHPYYGYGYHPYAYRTQHYTRSGQYAGHHR
jgi:hypothetical protein